MSDAPIRVFALSGSLRQASYNTATLRAMAARAPKSVEVTVATCHDVPLYNPDTAQGAPPPAVAAIAEGMRQANAVVLCSPEYNYSISGVLKNTIDWLSRADPQPFDDKVVAILGASPGLFGTARAQYQLRQMLIYLNARLVNKPEVMIGAAHTKFDDDGNLTDETTAAFLDKLLRAAIDLSRRLASD
ncbi:MAG: NAD(P)H-dependent oxidoreductase [Acidobacteriota bacterium]